MRVDWPVLMRAGLGQLGLRPIEFWALTPAELQMMLGGGAIAPPMGRSGLAAMMATFPDEMALNGDET